MVLSFWESAIDPLAFADNSPVEQVAGGNFPLEIGEGSFIIRVDGETISPHQAGVAQW